MLSRWTIDLFKKGYSKILGPEDLYDPLKVDTSSALGDRLEVLVLFCFHSHLFTY